MNYAEFKTISPEAKRRLAAECIDLIPAYLVQYGDDASLSPTPDKESNRIFGYAPKNCDMSLGIISYRDLVYEVDGWKPDESLDQVRFLENKAKEDNENNINQVWHNYGEHLSRFMGNWDRQHDALDIAILTPDEKLFCLFQAFGVIAQLTKEGQGK